MKIPLAALAVLSSMLSAQTPEPAKKGPASSRATLTSAVYDWEKLKPTPTPNGERRDVFDGATATVDQLHCHITTLKPGANSGEPRRHLQEEVILVKEGLVEASIDGKPRRSVRDLFSISRRTPSLGCATRVTGPPPTASFISTLR